MTATTPTYLPVTQADAIENKISQSVKISKQLMKAELEKRVASLEVQFATAQASRRAAANLFNAALEANLTREVRANIMADGELTRFRKIFNKFSKSDKDDNDSGYFDINGDMIREIETRHVGEMLRNPERFKVLFAKEYENYIKYSMVAVTVDLHIRDYDFDRHGQDEYLGYEVSVELSTQTKDFLAQWRDENITADGLGSQLAELSCKLEGIDQVAEQMEAQLLVQELNKTDEGREALKTAGELVGDMLGETPSLLQLGA